jgi:signal transduction histidine kinase
MCSRWRWRESRDAPVAAVAVRPVDARAASGLIVAQLLSAAINLVERDSVLLRASIYGKRAEIRVDEGLDQLIIRVRDHGPGIPDREIEKVFQPFYRLEGSRSRETGGTGLGLSIACNIAQTHRGDVRLRNHEDGGLEAILTLPWHRETGAPTGQAAPRP